MILEKQTETLVLEEGEVQESTNMEIDADSHVFLMRMLSKFYSDAIGSSVREIASNAFDSHKAAGVDDPIIVSLVKNNDGNFEFSVQDFGVGLDDNDVENIIKKYGKSTKRNSTNQLGAFGLGFKVGLAYSSSFYFIGRKNGIERKWMMYESDDESNKIDLLFEGPTSERNGVKVIIPVKFVDKEDFFKSIEQQLAYFEGVYFSCSNGWELIKNDEVKIFRSEHFQWSSLNRDKNLHICLGDVYYPIDWDKLGIPRINFPVGLRFSLTDGIFPVPNREQLKYTPEAKKIILDKIKEVSTYFVEKYNTTIKEVNSVEAVIDYFYSSARYITHPKGSGSLDIRSLIPYSFVDIKEPELKGLKYLTTKKIYDLRDFLLNEYEIKHRLQNDRWKSPTNHYDKKLKIDHDSKNVFVYNETFSRQKKAYIKEMHNIAYFVQKVNPYKLGSIKYKYNSDGYTKYTRILDLFSHPKKEWRERIKEFQYVQSLVTNQFIDLDKLFIPQEWFDNRKAERKQKMAIKGTNRRRLKLEGELGGRVAESLERYVSGKNCKFVSKLFEMTSAHKQKYTIIYGSQEDEPVFQKLYHVLQSVRFKLVIFSERELKNVKQLELHNWISLERFMKGEHKEFRRLVTSYLINKLINDHYSAFSAKKRMYEISTPIAEKMNTLISYKTKYFKSDDEIFEDILKVAEEFKLFDYSIYGTYQEIKLFLDKLPFINVMFSHMNVYDRPTDKPLIQITRDLFKYHRKRIDWKYYTKEVEVKNETINQEENELI
jgi:hypothetical protein